MRYALFLLLFAVSAVSHAVIVPSYQSIAGVFYGCYATSECTPQPGVTGFETYSSITARYDAALAGYGQTLSASWACGTLNGTEQCYAGYSAGGKAHIYPSGCWAKGVGWAMDWTTKTCKSSTAACPTNSTLNGGSCACNSGYVESGGQCIQQTNCARGTVRYGVMTTIGSGSVCSGADSCVYSGTTSSSSPTVGYYGPLNNVMPYYGVTYTNTGLTCASQKMTGLGVDLIDSPASDKVTCPDGQVLSVSGTAGTCAAPTTPGKTTSPGATIGTGSDGGNPTSTPGSSPNNPQYFDKSGLATDATLAANGSQAHADAQAIQGKLDALKNGTKIDETGTPSDGSLAQQQADFETAAQSKTDQINGVNGGSKVTALDWVWSPSIPAGQCETLDFSGAWAPSLTLDLCAGGHIETMRALLAWVYALAVCAYIWQRLSDAPGGK